MTSILTNPYSFNGVLSTDKTVKQNLDILTSASGCFLTFDVTSGKWCVIINRAGDSKKSFNDSNIIGSISITTTPLDNLYNSVQVSFPHTELVDQRDTLTIEIPNEQWFVNEQPNKLNMEFDIINNPVQATHLASIELKQSRLDKIITFRTDYSSIGIKAGDIIDVTNSVYSFTNKKFRVTLVEEVDSEDGTIQINITALEYDESIYNNELTRYKVTTSNGIKAKSTNGTLTVSENNTLTNKLSELNYTSVYSGTTYGTADVFFTVWRSNRDQGWPDFGQVINQYVHGEWDIYQKDQNEAKPFLLTFSVRVPQATWTYTHNGSTRSVRTSIPMAISLKKDGVQIDQKFTNIDSGDVVFNIPNADFGLYSINYWFLKPMSLSDTTISPIEVSNVLIDPLGYALETTVVRYNKDIK